MDVQRKQNGPVFFGIWVILLVLFLVLLCNLLGPVLWKPRKNDYLRLVRCASPLYDLGQVVQAYGKGHGGRLPRPDKENPRAYECFQVLVNELPEARDPKLYVCPSSQDVEAEFQGQIDEAFFQLTQDNVSYAFRTKDNVAPGNGTGLPQHARQILACDKSIANPAQGIRGNHDDGLNILYEDGSVRWTSRKDFEAEYGENGFEAFLAEHGLSR
jgi:hypothetical protein